MDLQELQDSEDELFSIIKNQHSTTTIHLLQGLEEAKFVLLGKADPSTLKTQFSILVEAQLRKNDMALGLIEAAKMALWAIEHLGYGV